MEYLNDVYEIIGMYKVEDIYDYNLDFNFGRRNLLESALEFATKMHEGQTRRDGSPYINHPIRVANLVRKFKKSHSLEILEASAYLHDTIEDTSASYYDIVHYFGPQIASIVRELTTDQDLKEALGKTRYLQIKMKNMSNWAFDIKLCDRLDNCTDLKNADSDFVRYYQNQTMDILEYLIGKRCFTTTQSELIKNIINSLYIVDSDNIEKNKRLDEISNMFYQYIRENQNKKLVNCYPTIV